MTVVSSYLCFMQSSISWYKRMRTADHFIRVGGWALGRRCGALLAYGNVHVLVAFLQISGTANTEASSVTASKDEVLYSW